MVGMWLLIGCLGLLAGAVSFNLVKADYRGGIIGTMIVGCIGALFGTWVAQRVGFVTQSSGAFAGMAAATLVLVAWWAISRKPS